MYNHSLLLNIQFEIKGGRPLLVYPPPSLLVPPLSLYSPRIGCGPIPGQQAGRHQPRLRANLAPNKLDSVGHQHPAHTGKP